MKELPLRTSVIGSYPFPGWLEFAAQNLDRFGPDDLRELQEDATTVAVADQIAAGLDVITDGEQSRLDFNLSFYGYIVSADDRTFARNASSFRNGCCMNNSLSDLGVLAVNL